jgi:hypothetical protein
MIRTLFAAAAICAALGGPAVAGEIDFSRCDNTPAAQLTRNELKWCDIADRVTEGMRKIIEAGRTPADPNTEAWERARARARPGSGVEVCGPDHWVKDHWEPTCR